MFRPTVLTALLALFAPATGALAQKSSPPAIGARVRLAIPPSGGQSGRYVVGRFVRFNADSVVLLKGEWGQAREDTVTLALDGGRRLERPVDVGGSGHVGGVLGALGGALIGAGIASAAWQPCTETGWFACMWHVSQGTQTALGAVAGAAGGALLGVVVGSAIRHTKWVPVRGAPLRVTLAPSGTGLGIKVAF